MVSKSQTKIPKIDFNPDLFNNIFWHLKEAFENEGVRYVWCLGGSSASKTYSYVQLQIIQMLSGSDENAMIMRKYSTDIKDSIYSDFKTIISEWGLNDLFLVQQNFIKCITGSYVRFRGLDDSEKIKGLSNFKRVVLEEISQFEEVDLKQIRKRLRGRKGQQIVGLLNPISEEHWLKVNVIDKDVWIEEKTNIAGKYLSEQGNSVMLKTNYLDNVFIVGRWKDGKLIGGFVDQHTIDDFEKDKLTDYNYYCIYGLGEWGKIRTGGEFWKDFNANIHVGTVKWNELLPIHMVWDENVNPYLTCLLWQIDAKNVIQIDEICLADPLNRVKHVCAEFQKRYPQQRVKGLFLYGDRTSWKEDAKKEKGENFFTDIMNNIPDYKPNLRIQSSNPSVVQSGGFINQIYSDNEGGIKITISENCKKSIFDYSYALEDSDGTIKKSKKTNPVTKVQYEEFGHQSDCKRYFITMAFAQEYEEYLRGGKSIKISTQMRAKPKGSY